MARIGTPVVIWINLNGKKEVDELHEAWSRSGARIGSKDGYLFRVFYDFAWELPDGGGRKDSSAEYLEARSFDSGRLGVD